jgi:hypothetical protein
MMTLRHDFGTGIACHDGADGCVECETRRASALARAHFVNVPQVCVRCPLPARKLACRNTLNWRPCIAPTHMPPDT